MVVGKMSVDKMPVDKMSQCPNTNGGKNQSLKIRPTLLKNKQNDCRQDVSRQNPSR